MTWAVGGSHLFCCRCIADNQVTIIYKNGEKKYFDVLQKIQKINPFAMIAFAGSVELGLKIISSIQTEYAGKVDLRQVKDTVNFSNKLAKYIKFQYSKLSMKTEKYTEFLLFVIPDNPITGIVNDFVTNHPEFFDSLKQDPQVNSWHVELLKKYMTNTKIFQEQILTYSSQFLTWKLVSPEFKLNRIPFPKMGQIGSGSRISEYIKIVNEHETLGFEEYVIGEEKPHLIIPLGRNMVRYIATMATEISNRGISKTMNIGLLGPNICSIKNFTGEPGISFPNVVSNWHDFRSLMKSRGISLSSCYAIARSVKS
jgi:hypothetical protein